MASALSDAQRCRLFERLAGALDGDMRRRLARLSMLTAGDFAAASRRLSLVDESGNAERLLAALEAEAAMKSNEGGRRVGFA